MSPIKEYKELALWVRHLDKGKYFVVPSCKKAGEYGNYYLNFYVSMEINLKK